MATLDLMGYLVREFLTQDPPPSQQPGDQQAVEKFVDFARKCLAKNQPTGLDYLGQGMALRLQDATSVLIVPEGTQQGMDGLGGFMHVGSGSPGKGVEPSRSWGVTGNG